MKSIKFIVLRSTDSYRLFISFDGNSDSCMTILSEKVDFALILGRRTFQVIGSLAVLKLSSIVAAVP